MAKERIGHDALAAPPDRVELWRNAQAWQVSGLNHCRGSPILLTMSARPNHRPEPTLKERLTAVPWWAWVGAAVVSHGVLRLAASPDATPTLAYLIPALFIVAAAVSLRLRRGPGAGRERPAAAADLDSMRWREFETLIGRAFELQGYHMNDAGAAGSDASIDLLMRKERQTYLVHCKSWRTGKVGVEVISAAGAAMKARGAVGGFVLSSGRFSREATVVASGLNIRLVDGPALQALLQQGRAQVARSERVQPAVDAPEAAPVAAPHQPPVVAPVGVSGELVLPCPLCGGDMKKRRAKRGVNAGQYFWGCLRHPDCRGTRRVRPG